MLHATDATPTSGVAVHASAGLVRELVTLRFVRLDRDRAFDLIPVDVLTVVLLVWTSCMARQQRGVGREPGFF